MDELIRIHGVHGVLELIGQVCENRADELREAGNKAEARAWSLDAVNVYDLAMKVQR